MKKIIIIIFGLIFFNNIQAQTEGSIEEISEQVKQATEERLETFSDVNKESITTGILYDRVIPFSGITNFNGKDSSAICTIGNWKQVYSELQQASNKMDSIEMPSLKRIFDPKNKDMSGINIPIYILNYEYNKLKENAYEDELLIYTDNKIIQNTSKCESMFETNRAILATPFQDYTYAGDSFYFIIDSTYIFSNISEKLEDIYIDLDDGFGEQKVKLNTKINVTYSKLGNKTIKLIINTNKGKFYSSFNFKALKSRTTPDATYRVNTYWTWKQIKCINDTCPNSDDGEICCVEWDTIIHHVPIGGDLYKVNSTKANTANKNSILIVEGFDLGNKMFFPELWYVMNKQKFAEAANANGFDIYILNFDDSELDILNNSLVVKEAIRMITEELQTESYNEIVVIGASMGGLVSRVAVAKSEISGKDPRVRLWGSFDTPHKGANIPIGEQYLLQLFRVLGITDAINKYNSIKSTAAKQLLINHVTSYPWENNTREHFRNYLDDIGYPTSCRTMGITCGNPLGMQMFSPGQVLVNTNSVWWYQTLCYGVNSTFKAKALPNKKIKKIAVFRFAIPHVFAGVPLPPTIIGPLVRYSSPRSVPIDNIAGGFRLTNFSVEQSILNGTGGILEGYPCSLPRHSFIPVTSALGMDDDNYSHNVLDDANIYNKVPFDVIYYPTEVINEDYEHVWITYELAKNFLQELIPNNLTLNGDDWKYGEVIAQENIHIINGFHANSSFNFHTKLESLDISVLVREAYRPVNSLTVPYANECGGDKNKNKKYDEHKNKEISTIKKIELYPNPTTNMITISSNGEILKKVDIVNVFGQKVYSNSNINNNKLEINVSNLPKGLYIAQIRIGDKFESIKFIIE